jgi:hypothetical protein
MPAQPGSSSRIKSTENSSKMRCETERITGKTGTQPVEGEAVPRPVPVTPSGEQSPPRPEPDEPAPPCPSARSAPGGKPNHRDETIEVTVELLRGVSKTTVDSMANSRVPVASAQQLSSDTGGTQRTIAQELCSFAAGDDHEAGCFGGVVPLVTPKGERHFSAL